MGKWKITGISFAVLIIAGVIFVNSPWLMTAAFYFLQPSESFADTVPPAAPDYSDTAYWASLPSMEDAADFLPAELSSNQSAKHDVAVFFVHPTTYLSNDTWNQPLDHETTNQRTDSWVMRFQASAFNGCCDVYAPRYRQATLSSFGAPEPESSGGQALALAYSDVRTAFHHFAQQNPSRPLVLAGHSQGSHHLDRLIEEEITGTPLEDRLVAAYPIGFAVDTSNGLPTCEHATQTRCQVSWNTMAAGSCEGACEILGQSNNVCVNPLTWSTDGAHAAHEANLGSIAIDEDSRIETGVADAQCQDGQLIVTDIRSPNYGARPFGKGNYHIYDYAFYYMNIRQNVRARVEAFMAAGDLSSSMN